MICPYDLMCELMTFADNSKTLIILSKSIKKNFRKCNGKIVIKTSHVLNKSLGCELFDKRGKKKNRTDSTRNSEDLISANDRLPPNGLCK